MLVQNITAQRCIELAPLSGPLQQLVSRNAPLQEIKSLIKGLGHRGVLEDGLIKTSKGLDQHRGGYARGLCRTGFLIGV